MTIKTRNRLTLGFLIFCSVIFIGELCFFLLQLLQGKLQIPQQLLDLQTKRFFLFQYKFSYVILSIFLQNLYVFFSTFFILRAFEKTQTTEIFYFSMFLLACLCDSSRLAIPLFQIYGTYSKTLLIIGNISLFSRLLVPLSLMSTVILNEEEQRQNVERNSIILIIVSAFIAESIPLNTSIIEPNLLISFSYAKTIKSAAIAIHAANILTLLIRNTLRETNQASTIGYIMLTAGNWLMFGCKNLFMLILGFILLGIGTFVFLKALHKYYLWND